MVEYSGWAVYCGSAYIARGEIFSLVAVAASCDVNIVIAITIITAVESQEMTDEDHSDSRTEDDYEEGEEAYDDEGTLDEEEMLHPEDNYQDELKMLEDDANLSIEELRQKYCNAVVEEEYDDTQSTSTSDDTRKSESTDDATANPDFTEPDVVASPVISSKKGKKEHGYFSDVDDNEEDTDYVPPDRWRRIVRQGPMYQASVPDTISTGPKSPRGELEMLLWSPHTDVSMKKVEEYLKNYYDRVLQSSDSSLLAEARKPGNSNRSFPVKDDEDALKALLNANYNTSMALASYPFPRANAPLKSVGPNPAKWNDQDCELFERGMQMYGKNFCLIKRLLPHRTVGEIVHFYYIWKKTERHDMFQERIRGIKNQDNPNCTDFMGGLMDHMDGRSGGNVLDIAANTVPIEIDLISKDWDWNNEEESTLPHLDSDTIANVLQ
ncbi:ELM2 domain family protein [Acanthocheilonema viteae]